MILNIVHMVVHGYEVCKMTITMQRLWLNKIKDIYYDHLFSNELLQQTIITYVSALKYSNLYELSTTCGSKEKRSFQASKQYMFNAGLFI